MSTRLSLLALALTIGVTALGGCDMLQGGTWGSKTTIDGMFGYKLGDAEGSVDESLFLMQSPGAMRSDTAQVTINGKTFDGLLELKFANSKISEIRFICESISSGELKSLQKEAFKEIQSTYSKSLLVSKSNSFDLQLTDANSHYLALSTAEATMADNDASFYYAVADHEINR